MLSDTLHYSAQLECNSLKEKLSEEVDEVEEEEQQRLKEHSDNQDDFTSSHSETLAECFFSALRTAHINPCAAVSSEHEEEDEEGKRRLELMMYQLHAA